MLKFSKSTGELFTELKEEKNLGDWRTFNSQEFVVPLNEYLEKILLEKNLTKQEVIKRSGLNREYAYHIFSGKKIIRRDKKFWHWQSRWI